MEKKYDFVFKFLLFGDPSVGKTSLIRNFTGKQFMEKYHTTEGMDFSIKYFKKDDISVKIIIWDRSGQESFNNIIKSYYQNVSGILLLYDICNRNSFININKWFKKIEESAPLGIVKVLIGNKCDKSGRIIRKEEGKSLAEKLGMRFMETSAKKNVNISKLFSNLTQELLKRLNFFSPNPNPEPELMLQQFKEDELASTLKELDEKKQEIIELNNELIKCKKEITQYQNELSQTQNELYQCKTRLDESKTGINDTQKELVDVQNRNESLVKEISRLNEEITKEKNIIKKYEKMFKEKDKKQKKSTTNNMGDIGKTVGISELNNRILEDLKTSLNINVQEGEKLLTIIFATTMSHICYPFLCKSTDTFSQIEKLLYQEYPVLKKTENLFFANGERIQRMKNFEENGIGNFDIITIKQGK